MENFKLLQSSFSSKVCIKKITVCTNDIPQQRQFEVKYRESARTLSGLASYMLNLMNNCSIY